ncbi:MAG: hypothetical protein J5819_08565 [Eubacterium sp.]|nr:hypothetical protein [Eubacterium sp.]
MSKYQFMNEVTRNLSSRPEMQDCQVEGKVYVRNNDTHSYGISIIRTDDRVSPIVYIDRFYDGYSQKKRTIDETVDDILELMQHMEGERNALTDISLDFDECRDRIVFRLVSASKNKEYLEHIPHIPFMDLAIVFILILEDDEEEMKTIRVNDALMEEWDVTTADLMSYAKSNTPRLYPPQFQTLDSLMTEYLGFSPCGNSDENDEDFLYLLSNERLSYGATSILYEDTIESVSELMDGDFYIIPSSIHEVLLLPEKYVDSVEELNEMIYEINRNHVVSSDVLSDRAYFYKKSEKRFYF